MSSMPTYDYLCDNGHRFELVQRFSDDALDTCVECGAPCRRQLHAPAIHFKGSGFYSTDYGKKGAEAKKDGGGGEGGGGSSSGDSSGGGDSSAPKTDAKPAAEKKKPAASSD
jgi:putative FmdB family regulatory protein